MRLLFAALLVLFSAPASQAAEETFEYKTVTTKEGLTFRVPEDMPIENRNGIQAPIPFDEYTYAKFKKTEARLKAAEDRLERVEKQLSELRRSQGSSRVLSTQQ